jgi:prophage regulatory protein
LVSFSRERVLELTFCDDFPEPAAELAAGDVWHRDDVEAWIDQHGDAVADMLRRNR